MAATQNLPVTELIYSKDIEGDDEPKKKSREDWRKAKELEEARKAGTAPAAVDEEGRDINPHIPQYISSAPWYFGSKGPTLKHQRPQPEKQKEFAELEEWYNRGVDATKIATKFRKGACENCGAMTHKKKDCLERPRKVGAKYTGASIAPDEFMQPKLSMDYDGKRDRWNGYDAGEHRNIVEEFRKVEEAKRAVKAQRFADGISEGDEDEHEEEDEDKYVDEVDMPGTKVDSKQRITVRNLRIREDTAKYLRNLDPSSAYYDPKTRSMRDNPYKTTAMNPEEVDYAGENFVRFTGDTQEHATAQLFAWEAYEKGVDVHLLAEPTRLEKLKREYEKKKNEFEGHVKDSVVEQYGGGEHLKVPPRELLFAQTEDYLEYSRHGRVIKGQQKQVVHSKYEEDVFPNNHSSVWGSFWCSGKWGYKCCHSYVKNSYCTGDAGKGCSNEVGVTGLPPKAVLPDTEVEETPLESEELPEKRSSPENSASSSSEEEKRKEEKKKKKKKKKKKHRKNKSEKGSKAKEDEEDEDTLKKALRQEEEQQEEGKRLLAMDERKRPYNSRYEVKAPTEEEMEAYFMKRMRSEDPMADFLGK